jgi:hypothetical protein
MTTLYVPPPELRSTEDTWHPSSTDTWHSFQAFLDMSSAYFRATRVTPPSTTCQHSDVRPPHQLRRSSSGKCSCSVPKLVPSLRHGLKDFIVGRWVIFNGGAKIVGRLGRRSRPDQRPRFIAGMQHARTIKFLSGPTIETMVYGRATWQKVVNCRLKSGVDPNHL